MIKFKQLEWETSTSTYIRFDRMSADVWKMRIRYLIDKNKKTGVIDLSTNTSHISKLGTYPTIDAAKQVAQKHHDDLVMSRLILNGDEDA